MAEDSGKICNFVTQTQKNMAALRKFNLILSFVIRTIYMKFSMKVHHKYTHHILYVHNYERGDNAIFVYYI
jgi:hypothetical protein